MKTFRSASILVLSLCALAAQADVTYALVGPNSTFTLTTNTFIASDTTFQASQLSYAPPTLNGPIASVLFNFTNVIPLAPLPNIRVTTTNGTNLYFYYRESDFTTPGTHREKFGDGSLTVTPVPEPATMAVLGVGVMAALRRRTPFRG